MATGDLSRLAGIRLLRKMSSEAIKALEQRGSWRRCAAHEQIVDRDSDSRDVFFVVEGAVEVVNFSLSGREVAFGEVSDGGYFGELAALDGQRRSASVVASKPSTLFVLPAEAFVRVLLENPHVALTVLRRLAFIIRTADDRIMDLSTLRAVQRVYVELLRMAEREGESGPWTIRPLPTQRDIARRASTSRETVARVLSQLAKSGIVARRGRSLSVLDHDRLSSLAEALDGDIAALE